MTAVHKENAYKYISETKKQTEWQEHRDWSFKPKLHRSEIYFGCNCVMDPLHRYETEEIALASVGQELVKWNLELTQRATFGNNGCFMQ